MLKALVDSGLRKEDFGLHSLFSGRVILAANKGVKDRLFKRHNNCKSENVNNGYIEDNLEPQPVVATSLGL